MNLRSPWFKLGLIVMVGAGLRLWNFDYRNTHIGRPDGGDVAAKIVAARRVAYGDIRPTNFRQPSYLRYTTGALFKAAAWVTALNDNRRWRLAALSMIAYSLLTIVVTYLLARQAFDSVPTALLAALILAVIPVEAIGSRYFKEDIPLMFYANLALLAMVGLVKTRMPIQARLAGYAIGAAVAVKYAGAVMLLVYLLAGALALRAVPRGARLRGELIRSLLWGLAGALLVFLAFNPYFLLAPWHADRDLASQITYVHTAHHDGTALTLLDRWGTYGLSAAVLPGMTWPVTAAVLLGIVYVLTTRRTPGPLLLLAWVALAYLGPEAVRAKLHPFFARYLHWLFPALCILAAWGLYSLRERCARGTPARLLAHGAIVLCLVVPLVYTVLINAAIRHDTRETAVVWMNRALPSGAAVYIVEPHTAAPDGRQLTVMHGMLKPLDELQAEDVEYVVMSSFFYDRLEIMGPHSLPEAWVTQAAYRRIRDEGELVREFRPAFACQTFGFHNPIVRIYRIRPPRNGSS